MEWHEAAVAEEWHPQQNEFMIRDDSGNAYVEGVVLSREHTPDAYEILMESGGKINGPYGHPDDGKTDVIFINWMGNDDGENMSDPAVIREIMGILYKRGLPIYAEIENEKLFQLLERRMKQPWTQAKTADADHWWEPAADRINSGVEIPGEAPGLQGRPEPKPQSKPQGRLWVYLDGQVSFGTNQWEAAEAVARELGYDEMRAEYLANTIARNLLPHDMDVAVGTMSGDRPQIWASNVDRNAVFDAVLEGRGQSRPDAFQAYGSVRIAVETPNQRRRRWKALEEELGPDESEILHQFEDGHTIRRIKNRRDQHREGLMQRHCWQHPHSQYWGASPGTNVPNERLGPEALQYVSLRDPEGLPLVSFHVSQPPKWHNRVDQFEGDVKGVVGQAFGPRNTPISWDHFKMIKDWANASSYDTYDMRSRSMRPLQNPRGVIGEPVPAGAVRQAAYPEHEFSGGSWDTQVVSEIIESDKELRDKFYEMVAECASLPTIRNWVVRRVISPYNKEQIAGAQEWNDVPQHDRLDHHYEEIKEKHPELGEVLRPFQHTDDIVPDLIDLELVNFDWLQDDVRDTMDEDKKHERMMQEYRDMGLIGITNHDLATNQFRDALFRYRGAEHDDDSYKKMVWVPADRLRRNDFSDKHWEEEVEPAGGYNMRMFDYATDLMYNVWRGQGHPDDHAEARRALEEQGYPPERIEEIMRQKWRWHPETQEWEDLVPKPQQQPDPSLDRPGNLTIPDEWGRTAGAALDAIPLYWRSYAFQAAEEIETSAKAQAQGWSQASEDEIIDYFAQRAWQNTPRNKLPEAVRGWIDIRQVFRFAVIEAWREQFADDQPGDLTLPPEWGTTARLKMAEPMGEWTDMTQLAWEFIQGQEFVMRDIMKVCEEAGGDFSAIHSSSDVFDSLIEKIIKDPALKRSLEQYVSERSPAVEFYLPSYEEWHDILEGIADAMTDPRGGIFVGFGDFDMKPGDFTSRENLLQPDSSPGDLKLPEDWRTSSRSLDDRIPVLFDPETDELYVGEKGQHHQEVADAVAKGNLEIGDVLMARCFQESYYEPDEEDDIPGGFYVGPRDAPYYSPQGRGSEGAYDRMVEKMKATGQPVYYGASRIARWRQSN